MSIWNQIFFVCICPSLPQTWVRNLPDMPIVFIGISPSRGSHPNALIGCGGLATTQPVTRRKYHYPPCLLSPTVRFAPYFLILKTEVSSTGCPFRGQQKERKRCAVYSIVNISHRIKTMIYASMITT